MHELLLFGAIPPSRHTQLLNILSGISSMQPVPIPSEKHLVFKPNRPPGSVGSLKVGGAQDVNVQKSQIQAHTLGDLFNMQLVAEVSGCSMAWELGWGQGLMAVVGGWEGGGERGGTVGPAVPRFA